MYSLGSRDHPVTGPRHLRIANALAVFCFFAVSAWPQQKPPDLTDRSLEDLMNIEITSVSKKEQKLSQVAAAIYVISQEEIRRSGATNVPDLLRMVPGLDVAQINANTWAISARGFNSVFANKLLVLIDGRSVYTPLSGGVTWDVQDVPLEDIERIEVIRGPGATIWGANAVNGVINIITKKTKDTLGGLVTGGGGTHEQDFGTVQYGGNVGARASYRIFTKCFDDSHLMDTTGKDTRDSWRLLHGGLRIDQVISEKDSLTTQGDIYTGEEGATISHIASIVPPVSELQGRVANLSGGNLLTRWNHPFAGDANTTLQFYYDKYTRSGPALRENRHTIDLDFQHHLARIARHSLIWGAGYRHTSDQTTGTIDEAFLPSSQPREPLNSFVQDEITLKPERVFLTLGAKLEYDDVTGFQLQPSIRVAWSPSYQHTFWAAVSHASRIPDRADLDLNFGTAVFPTFNGTSVLVKILGNAKEQSEQELAYEVGYRAQPDDRLSLDLTAFLSVYRNLLSLEPNPPFLQTSSNPPYLILPMIFGNGLHGITHGVEAAANWKVARRWTISPAYAFLGSHLHTSSTSGDITRPAYTEGSSPHQQARIRSHVDLSRCFSWDATAYFVGALPAQPVASYTRLDTQVSWQLAKRLELMLVGQNLLRDRHVESHSMETVVVLSQVKRSAYAKLVWRF